MPFDGNDYEYLDARQRVLREMGEQLQQVRALLADEKGWCKGALETPDGRRCILGAMHAVHASRILEPIVLGAIKDVTGRYYLRIDAFNDQRGTTHGLVLAVLEQASENVRSGMPFGQPFRWGNIVERWTSRIKGWRAALSPGHLISLS